MLIPKKKNNLLKSFGPNENKESILKEQDIKRDYRDLIVKSLDTRSYVRDSL